MSPGVKNGRAEFSEVLRRIQNHANLPGAGPEDQSLGLALWKMSRGASDEDLDALFDDLIDCLDVVNHALNGEHPSATPNDKKAATIDRWLCYSMACIFDLHIVAAMSPIESEQRESVIKMARQLSSAWSCVLAGDVDGILDALNLE